MKILCTAFLLMLVAACNTESLPGSSDAGTDTTQDTTSEVLEPEEVSTDAGGPSISEFAASIDGVTTSLVIEGDIAGPPDSFFSSGFRYPSSEPFGR